MIRKLSNQQINELAAMSETHIKIAEPVTGTMAWLAARKVGMWAVKKGLPAIGRSLLGTGKSAFKFAKNPIKTWRGSTAGEKFGGGMTALTLHDVGKATHSVAKGGQPATLKVPPAPKPVTLKSQGLMY